MKKILLLVIVIGLIINLISCQKDSLKLSNPNTPGLEELKTESGMRNAASGVYHYLREVQGWYYTWFIQWAHNVMGDATVSAVPSFGIRWANQTARIIRPDGTVLTPPVGGTQPVELDKRNARNFGTLNVQAFEWMPAYSLIGHCNLVLPIVDEVAFRGSDAQVAIKKKTYEAWFTYWKGHAYSRLGSIYKQGLIVNEYKERTGNYVNNQALLAESAANFNKAKEILATIPEDDATYAGIITSFIPSHFQVGNGGLLTPAMFIRNINSFLARNILVNRYASELTSADYIAIETLASNGIRASDKILTIRSATTNCIVYTTAWSAYRLNLIWELISERLVQDFRPGDDRYTRNIITLANPNVNPWARGYQYGTRFALVDITEGGDWMSRTAGAAEIPIAASYEENELMLAEVKIRRGDVDAGLAHLDAVRAHQNSELAATVGTSLTQAQAIEELRSERRIALFNRGLSFYDARRWGILKPIAQGGGRENANVVFEGGVVESTTIEYDYKEWWDVPANETDFNPITIGSATDPSGMKPI